MLRSLFAVALAASSLAQTPTHVASARPMPTAPRDAGVYHVVSGTWSHAGAQAAIGPDVVYNATRQSGYFGTGWEGSVGNDEGILPSQANPYAGAQDAYTIDGFEFGYCSQADTVDWSFAFYDSFVPCDSTVTPANCLNQVSGWIHVPGLPTSNSCWIVTVDLTGGAEFCMQADGGACAPGYQGAATGLDHFGWSGVWNTGNGGYTGPLLSGFDPSWAPEGEGTCYLPSLTCSYGPTALGALDFFHVEEPAGYGCSWFGGYDSKLGCGPVVRWPGAQLHMALATDCSQTCVPCTGQVYCDGAGQLGQLSISTCSLGVGPVLRTEGLSGGLFAMHLVGDGNGIITNPPGATGDLCLGGSQPGIGRYVADFGPVVGGKFSTHLIQGATGGGAGQLPNPPGGSLAAGQTWNFQTWIRVTGGSTFSPALEVTFEN